MDKEDVIQTHTQRRILAVKMNEIMLFAATWMDLDSLILSEVRQRKTNIICLIHGM